jgi:glycosyltransferase involved in cell wall biosynthesis
VADDPSLSVVVPTRDRRELLRRCLESFEDQTAPAGTFEVVVVVDGSTDGSVEMLSELAPSFPLIVLTQPVSGAAAARNAGAEAARGAVLLFVDDDMAASPSLVSRHLAADRDSGDVVCLGAIRLCLPPTADRFARVRAAVWEDHYEHLLARPADYRDCFSGNCSLTRALFDRAGGFRSGTPTVLEDFEFAYRLRHAGAAFLYLPDAPTTEDQRDDWRAIVADEERRGAVTAELSRRDPAIVRETAFGGAEWLPRRSIALRGLFLALGVPPTLLVHLGFLLPRSWARPWFELVSSYCYWRGVRRVDGWRGLSRAVAPSRIRRRR